jgi:hypothetical protein
MRCDLERAYIPGCPECQTNKSRTTPKAGPLHPLPIPDSRCNSVAIDFIGPLPEDQGYNCIVTMMDRSGSDIQIVPTCTDISAEDFALLFFDKWYCENGCPRKSSLTGTNSLYLPSGKHSISSRVSSSNSPLHTTRKQTVRANAQTRLLINASVTMSPRIRPAGYVCCPVYVSTS